MIAGVSQVAHGVFQGLIGNLNPRQGVNQGGRQGKVKPQPAVQPKMIARLEVKRGEIIDFITDCRGSVEFDSFTWAVTST